MYKNKNRREKTNPTLFLERMNVFQQLFLWFLCKLELKYMCLHAWFFFFFFLSSGTDSLGRLCLRRSSPLPELELGIVHTELESIADRAKPRWLVSKHRRTVCGKNVVVPAWKASAVGCLPGHRTFDAKTRTARGTPAWLVHPVNPVQTGEVSKSWLFLRCLKNLQMFETQKSFQIHLPVYNFSPRRPQISIVFLSC